jgi:hypothetical protein
MEETMMVDLNAALERLAAAAEALERAVARQNEVAVEAQESVARIVAESESTQARELAMRLEQAEAKLAATETRLASLTAAAGRKTLSTGTATLLAKQGLDVGTAGLEAGALDGALAHLSVEQRIAVKAELMRAGLVG